MTSLTFKLNTGAEIPALGLGTWQSAEGQVRNAVAHAIASGYRHIDAACVYDNEKEVGEGIKDGLAATGISRSDLFVTAKIWYTYHTRVQEALDLSLKALGLECVDLYLMYWPVTMNPDGNHDKFPKLADGSRDLILDRSHVATYREMEKLLQTGKVKAIGEIVDLCAEKGILITAYSPFGSKGGPLISDLCISKLAKQKKSSAGSILLSYQISRGNAVLAKSVTPARIQENTKTTPLSATDLEMLTEISRTGARRFVYPAFGIDFGFPDKSST